MDSRPALRRMIPPFPGVRDLLLSGLLGGLLAVACTAMAAAEAPPKPNSKPNPGLTPVEVVKIQLEALANIDKPTPDAGFDIVFGFASPGNRSQTGPVKHFASLIRESYPAMLNHRSAVLAPLMMKGEQALQGVELTDRLGVVHRYVFILSRQTEAPYAGCWMTDGVFQSADEKPAVET